MNKISLSRIFTLIGGIGAFASAIASAVQAINPKWGALLAAIGAALAMFNERVTGGLSDASKRQTADIVARQDEAARKG